jgi:hypothetical protein
MIVHTFAFRWKPGVTAEQQARVVSVIRALKGQILGLLATYVGTNFLRARRAMNSAAPCTSPTAPLFLRLPGKKQRSMLQLVPHLAASSVLPLSHHGDKRHRNCRAE